VADAPELPHSKLGVGRSKPGVHSDSRESELLTLNLGSTMILIADAHVSPAQGNMDEFFAMLRWLAETDHDVVFLGDILDLWIALPRFEQDFHRQFAAWCQEQKACRVVGFTEGNHEFFLHQERIETFTFCVPHLWRDSRDQLFCHGDLINVGDWGYRLFRRVTKSGAIKCLLKWLPGAPGLASLIKRKMNARTRTRPKFLPEPDIRRFAETCFAQGVKTVFCGHFHQHHEYRGVGGGVCHTIPQWSDQGQVGLWEGKSEELRIMPWRTLVPWSPRTAMKNKKMK